MTRSGKASSSVLALALALLLLLGADHLLASSRAAGLCALFRPGLDGAQVNALVGDLPGKPGLLRIRGDPGRMLTTAPEGARRQEFLQFAIVFKGLFFSSRQCVVSVKAGRVERNHVAQADAYVTLSPVQTVRSR